MNNKRSACLLAATVFPILSLARSADACGGFFCNASRPVNQAAERIIFADNGDGSVTAVIQIQYAGPSESFSWLLPIPTAPTELKIASDDAFETLQMLTNPQYQLLTSFEGGCLFPPTSQAGGGGFADAGVDASEVQQIASGSVGPYDWTVISVNDSVDDKSGAAKTWLTENGYDVPPGVASLLNPYLEDHMVLLALRLQKGQSTGSLRPIVLTYTADAAMIPVTLTAVAATKNMGVMTWLLGESRAVPGNYNSLELNDARINWFNPGSNYDDVVNEAADDAGGQGFVTEFAGSTDSLKGRIWSHYMQLEWQTFMNDTGASDKQRFQAAVDNWGALDGFWEATQKAITLQSSIELESFRRNPVSYIGNGATLDQTALLEALREFVIEPIQLVQDLIDAHPKLTRLYTTLSAEEMTVDPLFIFNKDLPDVSNVHQATRVFHCEAGQGQAESPWTIEFPQGGVLQGTGLNQTWPEALSGMPPNLRISKLSEKGMGKVLDDNGDAIAVALEAYNNLLAPASSIMNPPAVPSGTTKPEASPSAAPKPTGMNAAPVGQGDAGSGTAAGGSPATISSTNATPNLARSSSGCDCSVSAPSKRMNSAWAGFALAALPVLRRRRKLTT